MPRGGAAAILLSATLATTPASARAADKPTVVLVHGAFADASGFGAVTGRLQRRDYTISPAKPLRGPASDAAYVASVMRTISGPIVLVTHSYYRASTTPKSSRPSMPAASR
jgi:pimeloyl-ACP methyl ester carboxylesterase